MLRIMIWLAAVIPAPALADAVVAAQTLRAGTVLSAEHLRIDPQLSGPLSSIDAAEGMQLRAMVSEGKPIDPSLLTSPHVIKKNQIVTIFFERTSLRIETEGRALSSGSVGELIKVMNNNSRTTVTGRVVADGTVVVAQY